MPSGGPPPFRWRGGGLTWRRSCYAQRLSLRGRSPRRCGPGLSRNAASDAGQRGFPASAAEKQSEAAPRVSPLARRNGAPHERGAGGESDPTLLTAGAPRGRAKVAARVAALCPSCGEVALTTLIPGGKAIEPLARSWWMSVSPCSFVTCLLLYVLSCILCCTVFHFLSASFPKPVNVSSSSAPSGPSTSAPGYAPSSKSPATASSAPLPRMRMSLSCWSSPRPSNPSLDGPRPD